MRSEQRQQIELELRQFNQLTADTNLTGKQIETDIVGDNCVRRRQR